LQYGNHGEQPTVGTPDKHSLDCGSGRCCAQYMTVTEPHVGMAAGVPFVALSPEGDPVEAAIVVAWHGTDPPRTARSMVATLPLSRLNAWRIYLDLPRHGRRAAGEAAREAVGEAAAAGAGQRVDVLDPIVEAAAGEFPDVLAELGARLPLGEAPLGLLGGGAGAAVAQLVLSQAGLPVRAAVFINPVPPLRGEPAILAQQSWPALIVMTGHDDDAGTRLWSALNARTGVGARASLVTLPHIRRALADEPGVEPAPQNPDAARVDSAVTDWFRRNLTADWRQ
jgi:pimeloyl-ACP methyl ester carboxylesterase